ncbi:receptor-like cytosolic serine/threonine-protein kinase RBK1 isoform X1 [Gossypium australe]|uniref:non-specific serine/threonine protein kinase n=1 Tax=Gossypium australe TaxID=47621 RepID=A0A5B6V4Z5_9ROSI|nr:receptor-like cytosolic serine/threonine-protein kinase RBK1 isoform X1 [Gossypium australe]
MAMEETGRETVEEKTPEKESKSNEMRSESVNEQPSPRCVLEIPVLGSDSDTSSCSSNSSSYSSRKPVFQKGNKDSMNLIGNVKKKYVRSFSLIPLLTSNDKNLRRTKLAKLHASEEEHVDINSIPVPKPSWKNFTYSELAAATDNFSSENLIGKGGHAEVYKGHLSDGQIVAVKKLMKNEKQEEDRATCLIGFSVDGGLHLVLQFSPHGSLSSVLFGSPERLDWKTRFKVAIGIADGLKYLHYDCQRRIIHRDIKASNILLTEDYEAQISDFGLAKWLPENWPHHVVHPIEGTFGYLAPEYFMHGIVDEKIDVFAFGVLLLEIITGRRAVDSARQSLVIWAKPLLQQNEVKELVDPGLGDNYDPSEMKRTMITASMCINHSASKRPTMIRVVELLKNKESPVEGELKYCGERGIIADSLDLQDYSRTSYLNDLNRHKQLVME